MSSIAAIGRDSLMITYMSSTPESVRSYHLRKAYQRENQEFQEFIPEGTSSREASTLSRSHHAPRSYVCRLEGYQPSLQDLIIHATTASTDQDLFESHYATRDTRKYISAKPRSQSEQQQASMFSSGSSFTDATDGEYTHNMKVDNERGQDSEEAKSNNTIIGMALDLTARSGPPAAELSEGQLGSRDIALPALVTLSKAGTLGYWFISNREIIHRRSSHHQLANSGIALSGQRRGNGNNNAATPGQPGDNGVVTFITKSGPKTLHMGNSENTNASNQGGGLSSSAAAIASRIADNTSTTRSASVSGVATSGGFQKQKNKRVADEMEAQGAEMFDEQRASFQRRTATAWTEAELDADCESSDSSDQNSQFRQRKRIKRNSTAFGDEDGPPLNFGNRGPFFDSAATHSVVSGRSSTIASQNTQASAQIFQQPNPSASPLLSHPPIPAIRVSSHDIGHGSVPTPGASPTRSPTSGQHISPANFLNPFNNFSQHSTPLFPPREIEPPESPWNAQNEQFPTISAASEARSESDIELNPFIRPAADKTTAVSSSSRFQDLNGPTTEDENQEPEQELMQSDNRGALRNRRHSLRNPKQRQGQFRPRVPSDQRKPSNRSSSGGSHANEKGKKWKNHGVMTLPFRPQARRTNIFTRDAPTTSRALPGTPGRTTPSDDNGRATTNESPATERDIAAPIGNGQNDVNHENDDSASPGTHMDVSRTNEAPASEVMNEKRSGFSFGQHVRKESSSATGSANGTTTDTNTAQTTASSATASSPHRNQGNDGHEANSNEQSVLYLPL